MSHLVFVYGLSLDAQGLVAFAESRGLDPSVMHPGVRAFLPDTVFAFDHDATSSGAGGVGLRPHRGGTLAGMLLRIDGPLTWLDDKEAGDGGLRERGIREVLTEDGQTHRAIVYRTREDARRAHVAPPAELVETLVRALVRVGHDPSPIRAAALGRRPSTEPSSIFVYGTLRKGECRAELLDRHDPFEGGKGVVRGSVAGRLLDLGEYPGLLLCEDRTVRAQGEVYTFADLDALFRELDEVEGFNGYDGDEGEYRRAIVRVDLDGRERICWTYVYRGEEFGRSTIASGDWLRRTPPRPSVSGAVA